VVETTGHGIGRLRRALEALGYEVRRVTLATQGIPTDCAMVVVANPRNTFLPDESTAVENYLQQGGAAMLLFDLGFVFEPRLQALLQRLGVQVAQSVIIDEREHYATDPEMVAVTSYEPHPVTKTVSLTFFPGARPLILGKPAPGLSITPIVASGRDSITRPVGLADVRQVAQAAAPTADPDGEEKKPRVIVAAVEGKLGTGATRVIVSGDADFASNSFLPYMANSDLALSMVRWLVREENLAPVSSRIPVPPMVLLTKPQMQLIFVFVEILLPLAVFALGCVMWWRRR
jgi:ABC-type uncharacterized transport system involved in gliding motility auxiliary subunit